MLSRGLSKMGCTAHVGGTWRNSSMTHVACHLARAQVSIIGVCSAASACGALLFAWCCFIQLSGDMLLWEKTWLCKLEQFRFQSHMYKMNGDAQILVCLRHFKSNE